MALNTQANEQFEEQRQIHVKHKQTYQLMGGITLLLIGVWIGAQLFGGDAGFTTNLYTEALSIGVTVLVLNWFADRRATRQRKQELFLQLGSQSNDFALEAKRQLEIEGWLEEALARKQFPWAGWQWMQLEGMTLEHSDLSHADLRNATLLFATLVGANLNYTDLTGANLFAANLSGANLARAHLEDALLSGANLSGVRLWDANLSQSHLGYATLENADLNGIYLNGAFLLESSLANAKLSNAHFNANTTLPDGTKWAADTDMSRFTDPNHPNFWRSHNPKSPAFKELES